MESFALGKKKFGIINVKQVQVLILKWVAFLRALTQQKLRFQIF
jgi:hypothetical protein